MPVTGSSSSSNCNNNRSSNSSSSRSSSSKQQQQPAPAARRTRRQRSICACHCCCMQWRSLALGTSGCCERAGCTAKADVSCRILTNHSHRIICDASVDSSSHPFRHCGLWMRSHVQPSCRPRCLQHRTESDFVFPGQASR